MRNSRISVLVAIVMGGFVLTGCVSQNGGAVASDPSGVVQDDKPLKEYQHAGMLDPSKANETAPDVYKVKFETSKGDFVIEVTRKWSPMGADRFYNLAKIGYFEDVLFFRCIPDFMSQFGIHGDPAVNAKWKDATIKDDKRRADVSNEVGYLTFAKTGAPNSRSVQFFINSKHNGFLDSQGFTPIGKIVEGMDNFNKLNKEYEGKPSNFQGEFNAYGNKFMLNRYPNLDRIKKASIVRSSE